MNMTPPTHIPCMQSHQATHKLTLPLWSWGGCSGCFQRWRASTLRLQPAASRGGNFLHWHTPVWGSTSCPGHTNHIRTWGQPSGTCHSCPATLCTCTGGLAGIQTVGERQIWYDWIFSVNADFGEYMYKQKKSFMKNTSCKVCITTDNLLTSMHVSSILAVYY